MTTAPPPPKSDLGVRTASAVVMIAVAGSALWLGGYWWTAFVAAVALGVLWEWVKLVLAFAPALLSRILWVGAGLIYVCVAAFALRSLRNSVSGIEPVLMIVGAVIAVDVGAYFAGRTFGGPKIAPSISPSKTWAGLFGAIVAVAMFSSIAMVEKLRWSDYRPNNYFMMIDWQSLLIASILISVVAQSGDFFESWMKRRAGVKDSGNLIPGHGGLFDRVDGLLAVTFVLGLVMVGSIAATHDKFDDSSIKLHR